MSAASGMKARVLCLAGPTASGKSAAAMRLSQVRPIEIVSVDSAQVYRGMDIGTAKPSADERAAVPHHLLDICGIEEAYSAARFATDAQRLIDEIHDRGRTPVLVGGTMLYFKALWGGLDAIPNGNDQERRDVRAAIEARAATLGWPALHAELAQVDPTTAARLHATDAQRISRALEVWQLTGQPLSSFHRESEQAPSGPPERTLLISLEPEDRATLHRRIDARFLQMMHEGFLDEVGGLRLAPGFSPGLPSMRCVGYRQLLEAFGSEGQVPSGKILAAAVSSAQAASRQLAKRQLTWLRSIPGRIVVASDGADPAGQVLSLVDTHMEAA